MDASKKIAYILVWMFLFCHSVSVGQQLKLNLNQEVILPPGSIRIDSLLKLTARQTGIVFSFDAKKLNRALNVKIPFSKATLGQVLDAIKLQTKLEFTVIENYIVLNESKPEFPLSGTKAALQPKPTRLNIPNPTIDNKSSSAKTRTIVLEKNSSAKISIDSMNYAHSKSIPNDENLLIDSDETVALDTGFNLLDQDTDTLLMQKSKEKVDSVLVDLNNTSISIIPVPIVTKPMPITDSLIVVAKKKKTFNRNFFLQVGLSVDETLYAGSSIYFGIPLLFGTVSFNTNFTVSQFRYGVGTSVRINNQTKLVLLANFGDLKREFKGTSSTTDSLRQETDISLRSKIFRIGLLAEINVSEKWRFQVGPLFNSVKTNYSVNGLPSGLGSIEANADGKYFTIKPLYSIKNTYSPTSSTSIQNWIGLQLNIFYTINFNRD